MGRQVTNSHVLIYWFLKPVIQHGYVETNFGLKYFSEKDRRELGEIVEEFDSFRYQGEESGDVDIRGPNVEIHGQHIICEDRFPDRETPAYLLERLHLVLQRNPVHPEVYIRIQEVFEELGQNPSNDLAAAIKYAKERNTEYRRALNTARRTGIPTGDPHPTIHWEKEKIRVRAERKSKKK